MGLFRTLRSGSLFDLNVSQTISRKNIDVIDAPQTRLSFIPDHHTVFHGTLLMATIAIIILSLSLPVMTLQIYDRVLPNPGGGTLGVLIFGVCIAVVLETILRLFRSYMIGRSGASYEHGMACRVIEKILHADLTRIGVGGVGEYMHRVGAVSRLKDHYNGHMFITFIELGFVPVFLGFIIYIAHWLALVPVMILVIYTVYAAFHGKRLRYAFQNREAADDVRFNFLIESLEGVHTVKSFALENVFARRYEHFEEQSSLTNYHVAQETSQTVNSGAIASHIMVASVITLGAYFVLQGYLTTGALIATLLLSGRMMQPVQKAMGLWVRYQDFILAKEHVTYLLETPQHSSFCDNHAKPDDQISQYPNGVLCIDNIAFSYTDVVQKAQSLNVNLECDKSKNISNSNSFLFRDLSLDMSKGDVILISGGHASGKTTLLHAIAGVLPIQDGKILVDGQCVQDYAPADLVKHVGLIRAHAQMFRGTIRDNITCFGQVDEADAQSVARLMHVDRDVAKLPSGFDTYLSGDHTDVIPPGLRQRIGIVRSLAPKPRLILFDGADKMLDKEGYAALYSLLARLKRRTSMILVSDDCNIQALATRHYLLQDRQLIAVHSKTHHNTVTAYRELSI